MLITTTALLLLALPSAAQDAPVAAPQESDETDETKDDADDNWWNAEITEDLYQGRFYLNDNLVILADIPVTPTAVSPLSVPDLINSTVSMDNLTSWTISR